MSDLATIMELHDLDLLLASLEGDGQSSRWRKLGFAVADPAVLHRERDRLLARCERRWLNLYERSQKRYGRGLTAVRARICQGCFVQLPMSGSPPSGEVLLHVCENCGRLLLWR